MLIFLTILLLPALISCNNDNRPTRAIYHYEIESPYNRSEEETEEELNQKESLDPEQDSSIELILKRLKINPNAPLEIDWQSEENIELLEEILEIIFQSERR